MVFETDVSSPFWEVFVPLVLGQGKTLEQIISSSKAGGSSPGLPQANVGISSLQATFPWASPCAGFVQVSQVDRLSEAAVL